MVKIKKEEANKFKEAFFIDFDDFGDEGSH